MMANEHGTGVGIGTLWEAAQRARAEATFTFVRRDGEAYAMTSGELVAAAARFGSGLARRRERCAVVIALSNPVQLFAVMLGCIRNGFVAVPVGVDESETPEDVATKVRMFVTGASAEMLVVDAPAHGVVAKTYADQRLDVVTTSDIQATDLADAHEASARDAAIVLFSSGSVSAPKGVLLTNADVACQLAAAESGVHMSADSVAVHWLPVAHTFGLTHALLWPLLAGASTVLMSPSSFVADPVRWLRVLSQYRATHTGAPNFAYELLLSCKLPDPDELDLSRLQRVKSAGEPVRVSTLRHTQAELARYGSPHNVIVCDYGMSEIGCLLSTPAGDVPRVVRVDQTELSQGRVVATDDGTVQVVAVGKRHPAVDIRIVDGDTGTECAEGTVGDIWVDHPGIFSGYLGQEEQYAQSFATLHGESEPRFFVTGDRGFMLCDDIFVSGRSKDVIIVNGKNRYPADIEEIVRSGVPGIDAALAFGHDDGQSESAVILLETSATGRDELQRLAGEVLDVVSRRAGLLCHDVVVCERGAIPRTALGKALRTRAAAAYRAGTLSARYATSTADDGGAPGATGGHADPTLRATAIGALATVLQRPAGEIDEARSFGELGMDSVRYVRAAQALTQATGVEITPADLFRYTTLGQFLDGTFGAGEPAVLPERVSDPTAVNSRDEADAHSDGLLDDAVAIVGVALELPGGITDTESFWDALREGRDLITRIDETRPWLRTEFESVWGGARDALPAWAALLENPDRFDAEFFSISRAEAECLDPQQRKALEATWHVLEDHGRPPSALRGRSVGVFAAVHAVDYADIVLSRAGVIDTYGGYVDSGLHPAMVANRVSRWFDFHGPSESVNTACSSSMSALARAVDSLANGSSELAIVLGVNLTLSPRGYAVAAAAGMLSPSGRCRTLDQGADGFVRGEGVVAVALKPLRAAVADGDRVRAVIRSVAVNHDGRSSSLRAPNPAAQARLLVDAYRQAGFSISAVDYVEMHGTGTSLGDPIEVSALADAAAELGASAGTIGLGSVKTNLGHLEAAAGLVGVVKTVLALEHRAMPPMLHLTELNPHLRLDGTPFVPVPELTEWAPPANRPRRAGVSAFGFGGSNGHIIVEEAPSTTAPQIRAPQFVPVVLSAGSEEALRNVARGLADLFDAGAVPLTDVAYSLARSREALAERAAFVTDDPQVALARLRALGEGTVPEGVHRGRVTCNAAGRLCRDDVDVLLTRWLASGRLDTAVEYWAAGGEVSLTRLAETIPGSLIDLPLYPFARSRYWIDDESLPLARRGTGEPRVDASAAGNCSAAGARVSVERWRSAPSSSGSAERIGKVLVIGVPAEFVDAVGHEIAVRGGQARFTQEAGAGLTAEIERVGALHLLDLTAVFAPETVTDPEQVLRRVGAVAASRHIPERFVLAASVDTAVQRAHAESWIGLERSSTAMFQAPVLSVSLTLSPGGALAAVTNALADLTDPSPAATLHTPKGRSRRVDEAISVPAGRTDLTERTVCIAGGLGGLGLLVAQHAASQGASALILLGRRAPGEHATDVIERLRREGVTVVTQQADITHLAQLRAALDRARAKTGGIDVVINAAGSDNDRWIGDPSLTHHAVTGPKIDGTLALVEATASDPVTSVCLFSSVAAVDGDFGVGSYALANAFQAAWATHCGAGQTVAIQWPLWADGGMSLGDARSRAYAASGHRALTTEEGLALLDALMYGPEPAPIVRTPATAPAQVQARDDRLDVQTIGVERASVARTGHGLSQTATTREAQSQTVPSVEATLTRTLAQLLHEDPQRLDPTTPFTGLGADSLLLASFARRLGEHLGERISPTLFFEYPDVQRLAAHLTERFPNALVGEHSPQPDGDDTREPAPRQGHAGTARVADQSPVHDAEHVQDGVPADNASAGADPNDLVIVGMSGRAAGCRSIAEAWQALKAGRCLITTADDSPARADVAGTRAGFMPGIDEFDPVFFGVAPVDAASMDPRQRLVLQTAWSALQNAGVGPRQRAERTVATYVGAEDGYYGHLTAGVPPIASNHGAVLAARLAYFLDLHGPALTVNTACSSGLVAYHQAALALRAQECDTALACGVNVLVASEHIQQAEDAGMVSAAGECLPFDRSADGILPGEAVVAFVLRRRSDAERDGDRILAHVLATGTNSDGRTNGITAPSLGAQVDLITRVQRQAGIGPDRPLGLVVAHGTATPLGDPIEAEALDRAAATLGLTHLPVMSTKGAFGHAYAASGLLSLAMLVEAMHDGYLPGTVGLHEIAPALVADTSRLEYLNQTRPWPSGTPRRGAVSAFGLSGTNAHVVLEAPADRETARDERGTWVLPLSARTNRELHEVAARLGRLVENPNGNGRIADIAYTLAARQDQHRVRRALVVTDRNDALAQLRALADPLVESITARAARSNGGHRTDADTEAERIAQRFEDGHDISSDVPRPAGGVFAPVPEYPFARDRYWVVNTADTARSTPQVTTVTRALAETPLPGTPSTSALPRRRLIAACSSLHVAGADLLLPWREAEPGTSYTEATRALLTHLQGELRDRAGDVLVQLVVPENGAERALEGLLGAALSAEAENPRLRGQLVLVRDTTTVSAVALERTAGTGQRRVVLRDDRPVARYAWRECTPNGAFTVPDGAVVLVAGTGRIAEHLAVHLAERRRGLHVVFLSRRALGPGHERLLRVVEAAGATAEHRHCDVTDRGAVDSVVAAVVERRGRIDGVVHTAGALDDAFLLTKDLTHLERVLEPKVAGVLALDAATARMPLTFFVTCSSLSASVGNAGQADYAAANGFLDAFTRLRAGRVGRGERHGRSVSIGWPLWADGTMRISSVDARAMTEQTGLVPMPTNIALDTFAWALKCNDAAVTVLHGEARCTGVLCDTLPNTPVRQAEADSHTRTSGSAGTGNAEPFEASASSASASTGGALLLALTTVFCSVTHVPSDEVDPDADLGDLGLDSYLVTTMHGHLVRAFPNVPKTLFFEHRTLRQVAAALLAEFPDEAAAFAGGTSDATTQPPEPASTAPLLAIGGRTESATEDEPLAIIGMSVRLPGADNVDAYWRLLKEGRDAIVEIPPERWPLEGFYEADVGTAVARRRSYGKWGGFLTDIDKFDPLRFGISPREAADIDPQERLFLEESWRALEDAGYTRQRLAKVFGGRVGVFPGVTRGGYSLHTPTSASLPRTNFASIANRVSYFFDLNGPSMPMDSMCSSSLTAFDEAGMRIARGDCVAAIVGGVNLYTHADGFIEFSRRRMLSPNGQCRAFGDGADGMVPGEGVVAFVVVSLSRALANGDRIHGVVLGSAVNHGGRTSAYAVPNPNAQAEVVRAALHRAGVTPDQVSCIEAHGTGTALGDPLEVRGLTRVFGNSDRATKVALGSVKSNIGHLEAAAGAAAVTKVLLQMQHGSLAPTLHATPINRDLRIETTPFNVQTTFAPWPHEAGEPLIAGVSAFGAGGANAHVIVRNWDASNARPREVAR